MPNIGTAGSIGIFIFLPSFRNLCGRGDKNIYTCIVITNIRQCSVIKFLFITKGVELYEKSSPALHTLILS